MGWECCGVLCLCGLRGLGGGAGGNCNSVIATDEWNEKNKGVGMGTVVKSIPKSMFYF